MKTKQWIGLLLSTAIMGCGGGGGGEQQQINTNESLSSEERFVKAVQSIVVADPTKDAQSRTILTSNVVDPNQPQEFTSIGVETDRHAIGQKAFAEEYQRSYQKVSELFISDLNHLFEDSFILDLNHLFEDSFILDTEDTLQSGQFIIKGQYLDSTIKGTLENLNKSLATSEKLEAVSLNDVLFYDPQIYVEPLSEMFYEKLESSLRNSIVFKSGNRREVTFNQLWGSVHNSRSEHREDKNYQKLYTSVKKSIIEMIKRWFYKTRIAVIRGLEDKADPLSAGIIRDLSGNHSLRTARTALVGQLDTRSFSMNGHQGTQLNLGLPLFVQLKGSVDGGKSTTATTGVVAYRLGNTVIGAIQAYANSGNGFGLDGRQLETSVVASHSFGGFFVEGQLGTVSAKEVQFKDWSGVRSQVTLGIDTTYVSPFVQLTHRDFGDRTDTAAYAGVEMDLSEFKIPEATFNTHLLTKVGHHSVNGFTGSLEWSGSLTLNSGIAFTTHLTLGSPSESNAGFTVSFSQ